MRKFVVFKINVYFQICLHSLKMCLFSTDGSVLAKRSGPHGVSYVIESNFRNVRYRYYITERNRFALELRSALFCICVVLFFKFLRQSFV